MKWVPPLLLVLLCLAVACGLMPPATSDVASTAAPVVSPGGSGGRCGDGVCDGPENASLCPDDCTADGTSVSAEEGAYWVTNPTSGAQLYVRVVQPRGWDKGPLPTLVLIPGGSGDSSRFIGQDQRIADDGFTVVVFDPDGRGRSEGVEDDNGYVHQDGLAAVVRFAASLPAVDEAQMGMASWSYGITMAAGALARHPDLPVRFLIDWEGPADRNDTGGCDAANLGHLKGHACDDEDFWRQREAATFATGIQVPYQRLQSEKDHVQPDQAHTLLMINNATAEEHGGSGQSPWTRLNDGQANTTYTADTLPPLIPEEGPDMQVDALVIRYAHELFAMGW